MDLTANDPTTDTGVAGGSPPSDESSGRLVGLAMGGLLPIIAGVLIVPLREHVVSTNMALVLVVVVVVAAAVGGRGAGALAAMTSVLTFDFFFTRPFLSLAMASGDDAETALLLLAVGLVVGTMAVRARRVEREAMLGHADLGRLHHLAELVASGAAPEDVIRAGEADLRAVLDLEACRFEPAPCGPPLLQLGHDGAIRRDGGVLREGREGFELPAQGAELAVLHRGRTVGRFVLVPRPDVGAPLAHRLVAVALADQVGAAVGARLP